MAHHNGKAGAPLLQGWRTTVTRLTHHGEADARAARGALSDEPAAPQPPLAQRLLDDLHHHGQMKSAGEAMVRPLPREGKLMPCDS